MPLSIGNTITILEVMANPCSVVSGFEMVENEYIELYNYGGKAIDVGGWWISDDEPYEGSTGKIVSWAARNPNRSIGGGVTASTIIPSKGYAVILSPQYRNSPSYIFPPSTILLTVEDGEQLGTDQHGLQVQGQQDTVTLYRGDKEVREYIVSFYRGELILEDCESAERQVNANSGDWQTQNWIAHKDGTPGELCGCWEETAIDR